MLMYGFPCNRTEEERPGFSKPVQLLGGRLSSEEYQRNSATRQPAPGSRAGSSPPPTLQYAGRRRTAVPTKRNSHDGKWEGDRAPPSDRTLRKEAARTRRTQRPQQPRKPSESDKGPEPGVGERGKRNGAPRRRTLSWPSPQAARRPRLTPAPALRLDDRSDSPSRAVPMSWSSRARICAWADMVASGDGREAPHNSTAEAGTAAAKDGPVGLKPARRFPAAGNAGRKFVNDVRGPAGK
ncbi:hypothetical protein LEMLEM_LOCUS26159 [Lemmus lemmus]